MAVSIEELIEMKEAVAAAKKEKYDMETSIGVITVKKPTAAMVLESKATEGDGDAYLVLNCVVSPNLKDAKLQEAYGCVEPTDIVRKLFDAGEMTRIAVAILDCAGYNKNIVRKVHDDAKNSWPSMSRGTRSPYATISTTKSDNCANAYKPISPDDDMAWPTATRPKHYI